MSLYLLSVSLRNINRKAVQGIPLHRVSSSDAFFQLILHKQDCASQGAACSPMIRIAIVFVTYFVYMSVIKYSTTSLPELCRNGTREPLPVYVMLPNHATPREGSLGV